MTTDDILNLHETGSDAEGAPQDVFLFPASYTQKRMWFLDQFEPDSPYYNIPMAFEINGSFSIDIFRKVINEIISRHESLRTVFRVVNREPYQVILPRLNLDIPFADLRDKNELEIDTIIKGELNKPFNLSAGPLIRVKILHKEEYCYIILLTVHHIISDGWSMGILFEEIGALYNSFSKAEDFPLPEPGIQYADYSEWQREYFQGPVIKNQLEYWKSKLGNDTPVLNLPTDRPRPFVYTNAGRSCSVNTGTELCRKIKELCRISNTTLFMTLLAAFKVLLSHYSGQKDIAVGTPIAGRSNKESERIIGLFINTLVIRTGLSDNPSFSKYLQRVKEVLLEAYENQDLPFEMLVEAIQPERDMSYMPLFQVMFIMQNTPSPEGLISDFSMKLLDVELGTSTCDLTLSAAEDSGGIDLSLEYNTDLFDTSTVERLLRHYINLLNCITADPQQKVMQLQLMESAEKKSIIYGFNNFSNDEEKEIPVHQLFEKEAEKTPENIAVAYSGTALTYGELNYSANRLAEVLIKRSAGPDTIIGIYLDRSVDLLTAVLGVLKAGGAYLPLDPSYPADRIEYMLRDAGASIVITRNQLTGSLPSYEGTVICLDGPEYAGVKNDGISKEIKNPDVEISGDNLAYIIYTSGSTGKPKGTMIRHSSLANAFKGWEFSYELRTRARNHLQMASFSFDVFTADWVRALCTGGKLVMAPREILLEASELYALMLKEEINIAEFVPAVLRNLADYLDKHNKNLNFLSLLIAGSDVWYVNEYKYFKSFCGSSTRLINSYGVTESTIDSSFYESENLLLSDQCHVPIGIPFSNITLYILNEQLDPVPVGVHGELFIGGKGLSRGYLKQPALTAEKFIPDPFSVLPGSRLYRTGDMARYMADGNVEFLGRGDNQIKIRGFRIELGEIETALQKHTAIKEAVAAVKESSEGKEKKLVAYITPSNGIMPDYPELRSFLQGELPDYMIPASFVTLDRFPLTPNGKVDRKSLPDPDFSALVQNKQENFIAPRNSEEAQIAEIWQELLEISPVGMQDDFFELGGHSLLATQVISRVKETFNTEIPLRAIFETPTVEGLASAVLRLKKLSSSGSTRITKKNTTGAIPLSYAQERLWFLEQMEPGSPFYNMTDVYKVTGSLNIKLLERSINKVIRRQESLRTVFISVDGKPQQIIIPELRVVLPCIDLSHLNEIDLEQQINELINEEASAAFDITKAPLFRTVLIKTGCNKYVVIFTIHHIISDDWSNRILFEEIGLIYSAMLSGHTLTLPELEIQYKDFACWQKGWLTGDVLNLHLDYWKEKLHNPAPLLTLPFDHPRPSVQSYNGDYITFDFSDSQSGALNKLCRKYDVTPFMVLLSVFNILLHKYSTQSDIIIGTPIANRNHEEIERIIGFFVNTLVIRTDFSKDLNFTALLKSVKKTVIEAFEHQDLPFEFMLDALHIERDISHSPLFQVMFVMQNYNAKQKEEGKGLTFEPLEAHSGTAKFELTLFIIEDSGKYSAAIEYNTSLFDKDTISKMAEHFRFLTDCIVSSPEKKISELQLISSRESALLLQSYNRPRSATGTGCFIHEAFERQAAITPGAYALSYMSERITYEELNKRSNKLAHYLRKLNAGPDTVIGVHLDRSPELIISLLAILKSGGAYLPLGINLPGSRTEFMIMESDASIVITKSSLGLLTECRNVIRLDLEQERIFEEQESDPGVAVNEENLAYIIYTSGSTGRPKGVQISHRAIRNYINWTLSAYPLSEGSGSVFHSTIMFDATATAIFPVLLSGRRIDILPEEDKLSVSYNSAAADPDYSLIKITPAHIEALSYEFGNSGLNKFTRSFIIGGENLKAGQIRYYKEKHPGTLLFNEYGPTETTVGCIVFEASAWNGDGSVPIGRVIPGIRIYILDRHLNPVLCGISGELYIAGEGVARGYIKHPDLTAEKFIPDPFSQSPGERMYRTGDLVKLLKDGNIEYLGRIDNQVKIRGYRIEPGEIEAAMADYPGINETAVIARNDTGNDLKLVAYFSGTVTAGTPEIKEYLKSRLPDYMIPSFYVRLDSLPLTGNGKVDRRALPAPSVVPERPDTKKIMPRNKVEEILLSLWTDILGVKGIGINDNFFDIGGDSIISIQIIARANQLGLRLTPRLIFQYPTIEELAKAAYTGEILSAEQGEVTGPAVLTPIQHWFFSQDLPKKHHYNQSVLLKTAGIVNIPLMQQTINYLVKHHDALRMRFSKINSNSWIQFCNEFTDSYLVETCELKDDESYAEEIYGITSVLQQSLDLEQGPLFKAAVITSADRKNSWIFFAAHHLVADGVTWRILLDDILSLYSSLISGSRITLPLKTASYNTWSSSLLHYAESEEIKGQIGYWTDKAKTASAVRLPVDFQSGINTEDSAATVNLNFDESTTNQLLYEITPVYKTAINDIL
ncbi:MAG: amino acid adenylation domain-containing protein, partial [Syntrophothermus sp.]